MAGHGDLYVIRCEACHDYSITDQALGVLDTANLKAKRYVLAGVARNASDSGAPIKLLSTNVAEQIDNAPVSRSPLDVLDRLLRRIADESPDSSSPSTVWYSDFTVYYLRSPTDLRGVLRLGEQLGWLDDVKQGAAEWLPRLSAQGWARVGQLRERVPNSRQAFVAMSFAPELKPLYMQGIRPALKETGYNPLRVDDIQHNDKVDDRIVAELRRSGLVVADFTGHRGGVYFEAGYALGRGIPVIWCCRADGIEAAHFDTRQFNHLTWTTPEELHEMLRDRIRATLATYPPIE